MNQYEAQRKRWKMTRSQAAAFAGVLESVWARWERDHNSAPAAPVREKAAKALAQLQTQHPGDGSAVDRRVADVIRADAYVDRPLAALGLRIRQLRGPMTQENYAKRLSLLAVQLPPGIPAPKFTRTQVLRYENGYNLPGIGALMLMAQDANVSLEWLLTGEER